MLTLYFCLIVTILDDAYYLCCTLTQILRFKTHRVTYKAHITFLINTLLIKNINYLARTKLHIRHTSLTHYNCIS